MKRQGIVSLLLLLATNANANLVTNGDFQTGDFSAWTSFTTANGRSSSSNVVSFDTSGSGASLAARFSVGEVTYDGTQQGAGIYQSFTSDAGLISIAADIAASSISRNFEAGVFSLLLDSTVVDSVAFGLIENGVDLLRDTLSYSGTIGAGSHELRILIARPFLVPAGLYQYVDNVNVNVSATSVPEPATLTLLGLGVAGLCFSRRRS